MTKQYQLKLDLGEGAECHEAYEEYLHAYGREDSVQTWVSFCKAWEIFNQVRAVQERDGTGQTLQ
jgi:hypothetical protein